MEIDKLVKASIETSIIQAFKDAPEAIDALVQAALRQEVNEYGGTPDYHTRGRMPFLTWLVQDTVRGLAKTAVTEHISSISEGIKAKVVERLSAEDVVNAFTQKLLGHTNEDWRINVSFEDQPR